ncbi:MULTISPECIES: DMT family transporter [Pacificibacter]|uniref:DMT family transporter n=1 Tax=Pacificibacter TaxID=1042323 RepID=UPI001C09D5C9|nr:MULTISPECIES: DMT family transporter [Pacificibacter]MBU2936736.1 DMT family transporter [Pacificibacter marinus]MDO6614462.1 DMT family transporter [Pacificibacter sp. 1_MG-2023]
MPRSVLKTIAPREDKVGLGVAMMALAIFFFTCIDTSAKWLILAGLPALQVVFARYAVHFLLSLVLFLPKEGTDALRTNNPWKEFFRAAFLFGSTICNFTSLKYLPITVTTTIMFAAPVVVTLLAIPVLKEKVGIRRVIAVCVGFIGVLVVMQPWGTAFHPAMFLNIAALALAAMYFVMTRLLAGIERNSTMQLWSSGLSTLCLAPVALPIWVWPTQIVDLIVLGLIGMFGAFGHISATYAHRLADASILSPVVYIQLFLAAAASFLVFGTWPTLWTLVGGLIIIGSGIYIWQRERSKMA